jgi:uncharacterized protein CbrC (UPF0167 family)
VTLPTFRYHPDPIETGSIVPSDAVCRCCDQARGYIYPSGPFAEEELEGAICPWCIADGSAANRFGAEFTDAAGVGGYDRWDDVPPAVVEEVSQRTPGFIGWQQEQWWTHCCDAAAFLGVAGRAELERRWPDAIAAVRREAGYDDEREWQDYFRALNRDQGPTAYVFRCLHCGQYGGYSDIH